MRSANSASGYAEIKHDRRVLGGCESLSEIEAALLAEVDVDEDDIRPQLPASRSASALVDATPTTVAPSRSQQVAGDREEVARCRRR